jgi:hypothetical protein
MDGRAMAAGVRYHLALDLQHDSPRLVSHDIEITQPQNALEALTRPGQAPSDRAKFPSLIVQSREPVSVLLAPLNRDDPQGEQV